MAKQFRSRCNGIETTRTPEALVRYYEALAFQAKNEDDIPTMHMYFQHADNWKRFNEWR